MKKITDTDVFTLRYVGTALGLRAFLETLIQARLAQGLPI
jgi:hypothetical protein